MGVSSSAIAPLIAIASIAAAPFTAGTSLAGLSAVAGLAGGGIAAYGAYEKGQADSATSTYQAQVARNNSETAKRNADFEIESGEISSANKGLQTRAAVGTEKAQQGASGVDLTSGSAPDVRAGTQQMGLLDAITIRSNSARRAYGFQVAASSDEAQGKLLDTQAKQQKTAGILTAAGTLLSTASTVGGNYAKWQNVAPGVDPSAGDFGGGPETNWRLNPALVNR